VANVHVCVFMYIYIYICVCPYVDISIFMSKFAYPFSCLICFLKYTYVSYTCT